MEGGADSYPPPDKKQKRQAQHKIGKAIDSSKFARNCF